MRKAEISFDNVDGKHHHGKKHHTPTATRKCQVKVFHKQGPHSKRPVVLRCKRTKFAGAHRKAYYRISFYDKAAAARAFDTKCIDCVVFKGRVTGTHGEEKCVKVDWRLDTCHKGKCHKQRKCHGKQRHHRSG